MAYDPNYQQPEATATTASPAPYGIDYSQSGWSQEVQDYATQLEAQRRELWEKYAGQNTGFDNPDFLTPIQVQQEASDGYTTQYLPEDVVRAYMAQNPTISESTLNPGVDIKSYGDSRDTSAYDMVRLPYGDAYTFTNKATGETVSLSSPEQLGAFAQQLNYATGGGNNTANWEVTDPSGQVYAYDSPYTPSFLKQAGQFVADQLPTVIGSLALPGAGGFITAGLGSMAGAGIQGADFWDALKAGALTTGTAALTSFGANQLFPTGTGYSYLDNALNIGNTDLLGVDSFLDGISSGWSGVAPSFTGPSSPAYSGADLSSTLNPATFAGTGTAGTTFGGSTGADSVISGLYRAPITPVTSSVLPAVTSALSNLASPSYSNGVESVRVSGTRTPETTISAAPIVANALTDLNYDSPEQLGYDNKSASEPEKPTEETTLRDYLRYLGYGLTGASLLSGILGGAGKTGAGGTIPAGLGGAGKMPAGFGGGTGPLPTGDAIPAYGGGVTAASRQPRDMSGIDWKRYGFNPERSFFTNVAQRAKGGSMAVKRKPEKVTMPETISDGRSDDIPAVLSDGEYVIDAETVALLGNGSNKAGAAQLDRFRANIRKHKGKDLAKGRFSVNAKKPQAYLAGGRT